MSESKRWWRYDPGDGRCKHRWHYDYAGHVREGRRWVAKCPKSLHSDKAEAALNTGVEYHDERDHQGHPSRIYAVIGGVVYRAMPTLAGISYHGFPERVRDLPPDKALEDAILDLAEREGTRKEVEKWFKASE